MVLNRLALFSGSCHVYLAESPLRLRGVLPNKLALKVATSDTHWTDEDTLAQFATERAIMSTLASPFLVRGWPDAIEGDDVLVMEVGVCSLADLEMVGPLHLVDMSERITLSCAPRLLDPSRFEG